MFKNFQTGKITPNDVEIAFVKAGSGPPVLMLHGYPQTKAMWAKVAPVLAKDYTVVCADLRGYGDSDKPHSLADHSNYAFRAMAQDQLGLMRGLGFDTFHLVGHDRGARASHRLALDHPYAVKTLTLMDIVPTWAMFMQTDRHIAAAYWHWYFLSQPEPFPENLIGADPDFFFETCLVGWGAARLSDFDANMLNEYRRSWRDPKMIHATCSDYRAAAGIDLEHDKADLGRTVDCPSLIMFGANGAMAKLFDIPKTWEDRCQNMQGCAIDGGHFFVDERPAQVTTELLRFWDRNSVH